MTTDPILFEQRGHVALLTLNRPETRNALDAAGELHGLAHHTADHAEAVAAFFEKRAPVFGRSIP